MFSVFYKPRGIIYLNEKLLAQDSNLEPSG